MFAGQDDDGPSHDAFTADDTASDGAVAPEAHGGDGSVSDHSTIPLAKDDDMHTTQDTEALTGAGGGMQQYSLNGCAVRLLA
ncbi:hypothetical protein LTR17_003744 [Elasticomyces elasticus]|nr:hypothetical protein LTR17_003744 [Elasticomyces elasticus]